MAMVRRALLGFFQASARAFASHASPLPPAKALMKPSPTSVAATDGSVHAARRRPLLRYGALAAVASSAGIYFYLASGVEVPSPRDATIDDTNYEESDNKTKIILYGALTAVAGAGIFCCSAYCRKVFFSQLTAYSLKAWKTGDLLDVPPCFAAHAPSRRQVLRLTTLLQKMYIRMGKEEKKTVTDKDIISWVNRIKEVLTLPITLNTIYVALVTVWLPFLKKTWDGTTYCVCPFSEQENLTQQKPKLVETGCKVKKESIQHHQMSARSNYNFEKPFLSTELSRVMNPRFVKEMAVFPGYVYVDQQLKKSLQDVSAKSNYNFEKPFLYLTT